MKSERSPERALGHVISEIRQERKLSKHRAAINSKISRGHWGKIESGQHWPSYKSVRNICGALHIKQSELYYSIADYIASAERDSDGD